MSLTPARRERLLELARREELVLVEDDVYRELAFDGRAPPALRALDPEAPVVRLGSFAKTLAPGLRLGWIDAPADLREALAADGVLESGGCVSQFSAHVVAALLAAGVYGAHVAALRARLRLAPRRARGGARRAPAGRVLLHRCRPAASSSGSPCPDGLTASALLPVAERHRVGFAPGGRFCTDGDDRSLRLAFSLYDEASLAEGGRRLGAAVAEALGAA